MQVVRVSGTIKKAEEEAIRRARVAILKAKKEAGEGATDRLSAILGHSETKGVNALAGFENDDDEDEDESGSGSDGDG